MGDDIGFAAEWLDGTVEWWMTEGKGQGGRFLEGFDETGAPLSGRLRTMVQCRQMAVEAMFTDGAGTGQSLAWLIHKHRRADRGWRFSSGLTQPDDERAELYTQAFAIYAAGVLLDRGVPTYDIALETMMFIQTCLGGGDGWVESDEQLPMHNNRKQESHMHLLEATLVMTGALLRGGDPRAAFWHGLATTIVELCAAKFAHETRGGTFLGETFDSQWTPVEGAPISPGHYFEWVSLLGLWRSLGAALAPDPMTQLWKKIDALSGSLYEMAVVFGTDPKSGGVYDWLQLDDHGAWPPPRPTRRIWVQSEAVRAHCVLARTAGPSSIYVDRIKDGLHVLVRDFLREPGWWWEQLDIGGQPIRMDRPGSTLYHACTAIHSAIITLKWADDDRLGAATATGKGR